MYADALYKFKSKVICTLGPVSRDVPTLEKMLKAGMRVARFNFSHGTHEYHQETLDNLRDRVREHGHPRVRRPPRHQGPEIRTGMLATASR